MHLQSRATTLTGCPCSLLPLKSAVPPHQYAPGSLAFLKYSTSGQICQYRRSEWGRYTGVWRQCWRKSLPQHTAGSWCRTGPAEWSFHPSRSTHLQLRSVVGSYLFSAVDSQDSSQMQQEFGTILGHFVWCVTWSRTRTCLCFAGQNPSLPLAAEPELHPWLMGVTENWLTDNGIFKGDIIPVRRKCW